METQTLGQVSPRSVAPPRAYLVSALSAERRSGEAPSLDIFSDYCCWCGDVLPSRRRRYCSDRCAHLSHLAKTRAWKRRYRDESGHWPNPAADYWPEEKRRQKNREYARRRREHRRFAAKTKKPAGPAWKVL